MKFLMLTKYKWKDINEFCKKFILCAKAGEANHSTKNRMPEASSPNELWECDLIGKIPKGNIRNKFIRETVDHYTKWMKRKVINSKDMNTVEKCIKDLIIKKHGIPKRILTDWRLELIKEKLEI